MTAIAELAEAPALASALPAAVTELARCSFTALPDEDLLEVIRQAERARRQLEALDAVLIAELEARNLPGRYVLRGSKHLLADCSPSRRPRAAPAFGRPISWGRAPA